MATPIAKTTDGSVLSAQTHCTHGETHKEEAPLCAASTKGGGHLRRLPPSVDSFMDGCGEAVEAAEAAEAAKT